MCERTGLSVSHLAASKVSTAFRGTVGARLPATAQIVGASGVWGVLGSSQRSMIDAPYRLSVLSCLLRPC